MIDLPTVLGILAMIAKRYRNYYLFEQITDEEYKTAIKVIEDIYDEVEDAR